MGEEEGRRGHGLPVKQVIGQSWHRCECLTRLYVFVPAWAFCEDVARERYVTLECELTVASHRHR